MVRHFKFLFRIALYTSIFTLCSISFAQDVATGVSPPGKLGESYEVSEADRGKMICTVAIPDDNEGMILDEDSPIKLKITVRNFTEKHILFPKLEIIIQPAGDVRPIMKVLWLKQIQPFKSVEREEVILRQPEYHTGPLTFRVKAFDSRMNMVSDITELTIEVK